MTEDEGVGFHLIGSGVIACAGSYSIDGYKITHLIETSWNQAWTGTTQVSQFNIDENFLVYRNGAQQKPNDRRTKLDCVHLDQG
jgi:hypothetical protein